MIISTSSHTMHLTEDICEYVESALRHEFGRVADHVVSVDARLESIRDSRGRCDLQAVLRVDLSNHRHVVTEIRDDNLHAAVRRSAKASVRAVDRQLAHSRQTTDMRIPDKIHAFGRFPAPNV